MKVKKESEKIWLKTQYSENEDHGNWSHHFMTNIGETMETVRDYIFLGSKITADGDCSHEIKRCLLLGRKAITNLDNALKSRDITLLTKVCLVKAMVFPVICFHALEKEMATHSSVLAWRIPGTGEPGGLPSMGSHRVGHDWSNLAAAAAAVCMWELEHKESRAAKNWCFWTVVLEKTLESPLDCKEVQPVNPKGNQSWIFIGRNWCWNWNSNSLATSCEELTHLKWPWCWKRLKKGEEGEEIG